VQVSWLAREMFAHIAAALPVTVGAALAKLKAVGDVLL
jgi:hypothetical protein